MYTLLQISQALNMTKNGAKKALIREGISIQREAGKIFVDPAEFHRVARFSNVVVVQWEGEQPQKQLVQVHRKMTTSEPNYQQENKLLREELTREKELKIFYKVQMEDWKDQAQKLLLLPPADNKQKATPMLLVAVSLGFLVVIALLITLFFIR